MASFNLELRTGASLHLDGEPRDFVSEYAGVVTRTNGETGAVSMVGRVAARRVHAAPAHNAGEPLFDACDGHGSELSDLHALVHEPEGHHFREPVVARFEAARPDRPVLDHVVLSPK